MTQDRKSAGHWLPCAAGVAALIVALVSGVAAGSGGGSSGFAAAAYSRSAASAQAPGSRMAVMSAAAREFGVPVRLLLAISYDETRWSRPGDSPSIDGGYGLMNLTAQTFPAADGRGLPGGPVPRTMTLPRTHDTLDEAAQLLHVPAAVLKTNERQNVRGAAALPAGYARKLSGGRCRWNLGSF